MERFLLQKAARAWFASRAENVEADQQESVAALRAVDTVLIEYEIGEYDAEFALSLPPLWMLATAIVSVAVLGALSARWSVHRTTKF
jgi:hypothetical protein